ncbi:MAG: mechanosensitive ion channel family protein [Actinomycetota bacterium]|nr:mechanosensitive ion channel family protein [Actinomycetota bacterium]
MSLIALLQDHTTGEDTAGVVGQAGEAAEDVGQETKSELEQVRHFFGGIYDYLISAEFIANVIVTVIVVALGVVFYEALARGVPRILRWRRRGGPPDPELVARMKRQDTAITLVRNALRYLVFVIVALFVVGIFMRNLLPPIGGAAILAAVIGFGAQSFLRDVIAGFSIIFEGQYSVGDFIEVQPQGVSGIVEELGLRMTKIRALSGEVSFIPNGMMQGVTNYVTGQQRFNVEVQLSDAEAVQRVLTSLDETKELYLTPPRLVEREERGGRVRLRILADVLPSMAWLVEENLTERIKAAAGEGSLAAEPLVYKVDQANLRRIRELLPQEAEKNLPPEAERKLDRS